MDCFYDGNSLNWKLCWSGGCFAPNSTTVQNPVSERLETKQVVTIAPGASCSALPAVLDLGGDAFLATLAATLNIYRDRIDNEACGGGEPDYMDTLVSGGDALG